MPPRISRKSSHSSKKACFFENPCNNPRDGKSLAPFRPFIRKKAKLSLSTRTTSPVNTSELLNIRVKTDAFRAIFHKGLPVPRKILVQKWGWLVREN